MKKILVFISMILILPFISGCRLNTLSLKEEHDIGESIRAYDVFSLYRDGANQREDKDMRVVFPVKDINDRNYECLTNQRLVNAYLGIIDEHTRLIELDSMSLDDFKDYYYNEDVILIESIEKDKRLTCYITKDNNVYVYSHIDKTDKVYKNYDENTLYDNLTQTVRLGDVYSKKNSKNVDRIVFAYMDMSDRYDFDDDALVFDNIKEYLFNELIKEDELFIKIPISVHFMTYANKYGEQTYTSVNVQFYTYIYDSDKYFKRYANIDLYPYLNPYSYVGSDNILIIHDWTGDCCYLSRVDYIDYSELIKLSPTNYDHYTEGELLEKFGK